MKTYTIIANGVPTGVVTADCLAEARMIARGDADLNPEGAPMDAIWAEEA